jgi:IS30 family transposase
MAGKLQSKQACHLTQKSIRLFRKIKRSMRATLTVDNGKEFSEFQTLENQTGLNVYFADPYASWQRGCNENTNGLLRQFFLKVVILEKSPIEMPPRLFVA